MLTRRSGFGVALAALALLLLAPASASAGGATWNVNDAGDPGDGTCEPSPNDCTLRDAIDDAVDSDVIIIDPGIDPVITSGELLIDESLSIRGQGAAATKISKLSGMEFRAFSVGSITPAAVADIRNLTIEGFNAPDGGDGDPGGAGEDGGGIRNFAALFLNGVRVTGNFAGDGGNSQVNDDGGAGGNGGGIQNLGAILQVNNSTIDNNFAGDGGSAMGAGNFSGRGGSGGGISSAAGSLNFINTTVSGNHGGIGASTSVPAGGGDGGGIYVTGSAFEAVNSTVSDNVAGAGGLSAGGSGGGIFDDSGAGSNLDFVTIAGNVSGLGTTGGSGGGIYRDGAAVMVRNTLIAGNTLGAGLGAVGPNCAGTMLTDGTHNLDFPADLLCPPGFATGNPQLGSLLNNGGPAETRALGPGSAAIDQVPTLDCTGLTLVPLLTDQRGAGFPRMPAPFGGACDIGAFEVQAPPPPPPPPPATITPAATTPAAPGGSAAKKCKKGRKLKKGKCVKKKKKKK